MQPEREIVYLLRDDDISGWLFREISVDSVSSLSSVYIVSISSTPLERKREGERWLCHCMGVIYKWYFYKSSFLLYRVIPRLGRYDGHCSVNSTNSEEVLVLAETNCWTGVSIDGGTLAAEPIGLASDVVVFFD